MIDEGYLENTRKLYLNVRKIESQIRYLKEQAYMLKGVSFGEKVQTTKNNDHMVDGVIKYVDLELTYWEILDDYLEHYGYIYKQLQKLAYVSQLYIIGRYLMGMNNVQLAEYMGVTERHIYRMKKDVLIELKNIVG